MRGKQDYIPSPLLQDGCDFSSQQKPSPVTMPLKADSSLMVASLR